MMGAEAARRAGWWRRGAAGRRVASAVLGAWALLAGGGAWALEPTGEADNACTAAGGQGEVCVEDADCAGNEYATRCVRGAPDPGAEARCEIPCEGGEGVAATPDAAACAPGETCVPGAAVDGGKAYYCKPAKFRVDLNLVDQCIAYHLGGLQPTFSDNQCSLEANLTRLLDQNADGTFNIFDLDLCILAFLEQPSCDPEEGTCDAPDLTACATDEDCGLGLYCDPEHHSCQRDCGVVAGREPGLGALDRECMGNGTVCDRTRGRCVAIDVTQATCDVDGDCPAGSYCFLGRCAPRCYRSSDCPSGGWYCTENNRCRAVPSPQADGGFTFDPQNYAIRFTRDQLRLDAVQDVESSPLVVLDLLTKKAVVGNPSVSFGYRLEVTYSLKQDTACMRPFVDCADPAQLPAGESQAACEARQDDCYVDDTEQWLTLTSPFGTVTAVGEPKLDVVLDKVAADKLTPGVYTATVRAIYDNGDSDTIPVIFTKATPSGEYDGSLTVYKDVPANALNGLKPISFGMRMRVHDGELWQWDELLDAYHLASDAGGDEAGFTDTTSGYRVSGWLHGETSFAFMPGEATGATGSEVPFVGLYSPDLGRIRLLGVIEIPADLCVAEDGACDPADDSQLKVRNLFERTVRRQIEFFGPFDEATARFHGIYREKLSGLAADYDVTLEGGFILDQLFADTSGGSVVPSDFETTGPAISFPSDADVLADLQAANETACAAADDGGFTGLDAPATAMAQFASQAAFTAYLAQANRSQDPARRHVIFPTLRDFEGLVQDALTGIGTETPQDQQDALNIYDFLGQYLVPCDTVTSSPSPMCIREDAALCGLTAYQRAYLQGWFNPSSVAGPASDPVVGELDLFCPDTIPLDGCPDAAGDSPDLFALQEHNRFWLNEAQLLKYEADRARSDAFMVLYRNAVAPFEAGAALSYKADKLRYSVRRYDDLMRLIVGPAAAKVLFSWPARAFKQAGIDWITIMQTAVNDRLSAIADLVDLERRVFMSTGGTDYAFAQHLGQQEYLTQVYLMALEQHWQGSLFSYRDEAQSVFERVQGILNQLNPVKNAIGVTPARVFFENSNLDRNNWLNYMDILVGEDGAGGLLAEARDTVDQTVENLQGALADLDTLEESLFDTSEDLRATLNDICGDPDPGDPTGTTDDYCQYLLKQFASADDWVTARDCMLSSLDSSLTKPADCGSYPQFSTALRCDDESNQLDGENECQTVVKEFIANTDTITQGTTGGGIASAPTCDLDRGVEYLVVHGERRPCVGGEVGALIQEKAALMRQRRIVIGSLETLLKQLLSIYQVTDATAKFHDDLASYMKGRQIAITTLQGVVTALETVKEVADSGTKSPNCVFVVGMSNGTNCPGNIAETVSRMTVDNALLILKSFVELTASSLEADIGIHEAEQASVEDRIGAAGDLNDLQREVDSLIDEFNALTQDAFNIDAQIADARFRAEEAVRLYDRKVTFLAEHLVGRESGNYLVANGLVRDGGDQFRRILQYTYRATMAFIHNYNVPPGPAATLIAQSQAPVTLDDVEVFLGLLQAQSLEYCGFNGLDCDYENNTETLRLSLRQLLFPTLRDVVDAHTGKVLTAGQRFHNLITQPPFLKRRVRAGQITDQIEIPFSVPVTPLQNTADGKPVWLVDPLSCNHLIDGRDPSDPSAPGASDGSASQSGSVALNFVGENLDDPSKVIRYQLARGATDFIRACVPESTIAELGTMPTLTYPVRKHIIGYAPQSLEAAKDQPASFYTVSQPFTACVNAPEVQGSLDAGLCWRYFARDRALASPDWKIIIPLQVGGASADSAWITGDGLVADEAPVIEDIIVYFRYRSRPVSE